LYYNLAIATQNLTRRRKRRITIALSVAIAKIDFMIDSIFDERVGHHCDGYS
jgi:hypothetical protein